MNPEGTATEKTASTVYLDVCCLNRPFDDQTQVRIHMEAESVLAFIALAMEGRYVWVSSEVVDFEIDQTPDPERRQRVALLAGFAHRHLLVDEQVERRAEELEALGFHTFDALHLACAEQAEVSILLTTDDQFQRVANRHEDSLAVRVSNPLNWIQEVQG